MAHDRHEGQPFYSPGQILCDGCPECRFLSEHPALVIQHMTPEQFAYSWERAAKWERLGIRDVSYAETPVLRILWAVEVQLERNGFEPGRVPVLPGGAVHGPDVGSPAA